MFDANIALAVAAALLLVVSVRIALTLKDISESLALLAGLKPTVKVDVALPRAETESEHTQEPDATEIAAVIAVAKAALEGSLR
jgi:hypothetical protein